MTGWMSERIKRDKDEYLGGGWGCMLPSQWKKGWIKERKDEWMNEWLNTSEEDELVC